MRIALPGRGEGPAAVDHWVMSCRPATGCVPVPSLAVSFSQAMNAGAPTPGLVARGCAEAAGAVVNALSERRSDSFARTDEDKNGPAFAGPFDAPRETRTPTPHKQDKALNLAVGLSGPPSRPSPGSPFPSGDDRDSSDGAFVVRVLSGRSGARLTPGEVAGRRTGSKSPACGSHRERALVAGRRSQRRRRLSRLMRRSCPRGPHQCAFMPSTLWSVRQRCRFAPRAGANSARTQTTACRPLRERATPRRRRSLHGKPTLSRHRARRVPTPWVSIRQPAWPTL